MAYDSFIEPSPPLCVTLGRLAEHLTEMPLWAAMTMTQSALEMTTQRPPDYQRPATRDAVLAMFDTNLKAGRANLTGKTDPEFMAPWTLKAGGKEVFTMPKAAVMRNFVLNHMVHHASPASGPQRADTLTGTLMVNTKR